MPIEQWTGPHDLTGDLAARLGPQAATIGLIGDSITNNQGALNGFQFSTGYWGWANALLGHRLDLTYIDGVPGSGCLDANWTTRVGTIPAASCRWVLVEIGTNDVAANASAASIQTALSTTLTTLLGASKSVVLLTIPPRNGLTTAQATVHDTVNTWIRQQAGVGGVVVADVAAFLTDAANSSAASYIAAYTSDGIHPTPLGCSQMGRAIYNVLNPLVPNVTGVLAPQSDKSNLLSYGQSSWAGGGAGKPTNWTQSGLTGATFSQSSSRSDGMPGIMQTVVVPNGQSGNLHSPIGSYSAGDRLVGYVEVLNVTGIDGAPAANTQAFYLYMQAFTAAYGVAATTSELYPNGTQPNVPPLTAGVLQTPTMVVPANGLQEADLFISMNGGATYQFGRVGVVKVGTTY